MRWIVGIFSILVQFKDYQQKIKKSETIFAGLPSAVDVMLLGHFRFAPLFQNESSYKTYLSYKTEFDLHGNDPVWETHFHMNGFARRLALTPKQKATRRATSSPGPSSLFKMAARRQNRRGEGPGDEVAR